MHITRCIMDSGWGREPSTSENHPLEVKINVIKCKDIGKAPSYPPLGPHPVMELLGMGPEVEMLMRILYPVRLSAFSQLNTFRSS